MGRASADVIVRLGIRPASPDAAAGTLSGGNQQKVLLGRWLLRQPRVLLLDEPTRGVDIGARQEIYTEIDRLAASGLAVVVVSSDLPEVLGLSDRVAVLRHGRVAATFAREQATADAVMAAATGGG
jgi:ribose transport system ATP-binding protein